MGFIRANVLPLLRERRLRPFQGAVLLLGYPDIYFDAPHLSRMCKLTGNPLPGGQVLRCSTRPGMAEKSYMDYEPGILDHLSYGGLDASIYATWMVAEKTAASTGHTVPQQGFYRRMGNW